MTVAFLRCLNALPILGLLAFLERKRFGGLPARASKLAWVAGVFFAADLISWHHAIDAVGAGLATVLGNLQVVLVAFIAWLVLKERPSSAMLVAVPIVLIGVVLISGVVGSDAYGRDPVLGVVFGVVTSIAYSGFILVLRQGSSDRRRVAGPLFHATAVSAAAAAIYGVVVSDLAWPGWPGFGWSAALALTSQVMGWLLISLSLPRLPAAITSVTLLLQPVGAMALAALVLGEDPGAAQLAGAALILGGVVIATTGHRRGTAEVLPGRPAEMVAASATADPSS